MRADLIEIQTRLAAAEDRAKRAEHSLRVYEAALDMAQERATDIMTPWDWFAVAALVAANGDKWTRAHWAAGLADAMMALRAERPKTAKVADSAK